MRTAMTVALSCALLGGSVVTFSANALQCEGGQANVTATKGSERNALFYRPGLGRGHSSVEYSIGIEGKSAIDFVDIPGPRDVDGMSLYVAVGSLEPKELKYVEKTGTCLQYRAWAATTLQEASLFTIWGENSNDQPKICFDSSGKATLKLLVDVNGREVVGAARLLPQDFRVYVRGKRSSDGKEFVLLDTKSTCKG